ncbi:hypothetical protein G9A89_002493 [Geosiphon pyriformis]|nr:hypothetical protein G9A89_002493 [Geosiphon pyriformis]
MKNESQVVEILNVELFHDKGLVTDLWTGPNQHFNSTGIAEIDMKFNIPNNLDFITYGTNEGSTRFFLRTWGGTGLKGPHCTIYR